MNLNKQKAVVTLFSVDGRPLLKVAPRVLLWETPIEPRKTDTRPVTLIGASEVDEEKLSTFEASAYTYNADVNDERDTHLYFSGKRDDVYRFICLREERAFTLSRGKAPQPGIKLDKKSSNLIGFIYLEVRKMLEEWPTWPNI